MVPYEFDAERFSRWMAYVLRHNPERYGLKPDRHGYVDADAFLQPAQSRYPDLTAQRLRGFIESSGGARFEWAEGRIRARYGHSIPAEPVGPPVEPPPQLYHGTEPSRVESILADGLSPMDRRMLHLSETIEDAVSVARRRTEQPVVIQVRAQQAHEAGIAFHREGRVYLVSHIPTQFLNLEPLPDSLNAPPTSA